MKQIKSLFITILMIALFITMVGCVEQPEQPADSQPTQGNVDTPFDPENPYLLMATDIMNGAVAVINLDAEDPMNPDSYYWYWTADTSLGWKYPSKLSKGNLSDAKLRWSEIHQSYVVLLTAAGGWVGIAEYPSGKCLWETTDTESGPHAMELLPNGDVVVACSGGDRWETEGCMLYYDTTDGKNYTITHKEMLPSAHGALWDPENNVLWADGYSKIVAYEIVEDSSGKPMLSERTDNLGSILVSAGGHDLMPDYSNSDLIWITTNQAVQKYDKQADKILNTYTYSDMLRGKHFVKGVTSFTDGTVAYIQCTTGSGSDGWPSDINVLWPLDLEGKDAVLVKYEAQDGAFWNKVRVFDPDYQ